MEKHNPQTALQDYFSDLLLEPGAAPEPSSPPELQPVPAAEPVVSVRNPVFADDTATELSVLEQSKRQRLQALLDSKPWAEPAPAVTEEVDVAVDVATVTEVAEETIEAEVDVLSVVAPDAATDEDIHVTLETAEQAPETVCDPRPVDVAEQEVAQEAATSISHHLAWNDNGRPEWAQDRFDALLFDVAGLTLAVPLIALGQIYPLTDDLTPLFGQADWFMGLMPTPKGKIRTINTALFVMPERYDATFVESAKYVVSIDGVPWGLAVDSINQPISLDPNDVRWRSERTKRPWLAGTVKSAMCALIDIPQMGRMLTQADKNHTVSS